MTKWKTSARWLSRWVSLSVCLYNILNGATRQACLDKSIYVVPYSKRYVDSEFPFFLAYTVTLSALASFWTDRHTFWSLWMSLKNWYVSCHQIKDSSCHPEKNYIVNLIDAAGEHMQSLSIFHIQHDSQLITCLWSWHMITDSPCCATSPASNRFHFL